MVKFGMKVGEYQRFEDATLEELMKLLDRYGNVNNMNDAHNLAPRIGELVELAEGNEDKIRFGGYIIFKPRDDYRVSVDEVRVREDAEELLEKIMAISGTPDEISKSANWIYIFWD